MSSANDYTDVIHSFKNFTRCLNSSSAAANLAFLEHKMREEENAFYIANVGMIIQSFQRWEDHLPRVRPFYAVKCNPDPLVIQTLMDLGAGFDCASENELHLVADQLEHSTRLLDPVERQEYFTQNVIFANPVKIRQHMRSAALLTVQWTTVDSVDEIVKLAEEWPTAQLLIRVACPTAFDTHIALGNKFGAKQEEISDLILMAKERNLKIAGISFNVGSACKDCLAWAQTVKYCRALFDHLINQGFKPNVLDIGGGFRGKSMIPSTARKQLNYDFHTSCNFLNEALNKYFPEEGNYIIIAEPGRFMVEGAYFLATKVLANHDAVMAKQSSPRVYVDDGLYGSFLSIYVDLPPQILCCYHYQANSNSLELIPKEEEKINCSLFGPTCDQMDTIYSSILLPRLQVDDWIIWRDMGAYTLCAASNFNGMTAPPVYYYLFEEDRAQAPGSIKSFWFGNAQALKLDEAAIQSQEKLAFLEGELTGL